MPSNDVNVVVLEGNLTRDPEVRMAGETKVANFSIAVNTYRTKQKQDTAYVDIVVWGGQAEFVEKYFIKGKRVWVTGKLEMDKWVDRDGKERTKLQVTAREVNFGYGPKDDRGEYDFTSKATHTDTDYGGGSTGEVPF